ncbi:DNA polymerase eta [Spatholobus suberectus]|nr:DNA polymerase eta [Spatholobus suberectus]
MSTMSNNLKDSDHFHSSWTITKLMTSFFLLVSLSYLFYTLGFLTHSYDCAPKKPSHYINLPTTTHFSNTPPPPSHDPFEKTNISHIVFGIGASSKLWSHRKEYIKLWWRPNETRGNVWLDQGVKTEPGDEYFLPALKISGDVSRFKCRNPRGDRSGIRISRIVSETVRLGMENVRWFVMGDDDTFFVTENLVKVLRKYDHGHFYYIGTSSESHLQNIHFSYNMAFGGGGFAISYPLALALEGMQDKCLQRYPALYGSDDRIQACMAELGVPLTKEIGFHQFDVYGNVFGLLAAHPITPLVSMHHLDLVEPIFPNVDRIQALQRLKEPMKLDSYGLMQQSICYDKARRWTISVSWGYVVQIFRGIFLARDMEMPARTFLNWYRRADYTGFPFNTRPFSRHFCQKPFVFYLSNATYDGVANETVSEYIRVQPNPECKWKMADPTQIQMIKVHKKPNSHLWDKSPRRHCCRVQPTKEEGTLVIDVGECRKGEFVGK